MISRVTGTSGLLLLVLSVSVRAEPAKPSDDVKGREVYQMYCAPCHGVMGDGKGPVAPGLSPPPTDFTDQKLIDTLTDEYLGTFVKQGGGIRHDCPMMPSWAPVLRSEDVTSVVAYIRSLARR